MGTGEITGRFVPLIRMYGRIGLSLLADFGGWNKYLTLMSARATQAVCGDSRLLNKPLIIFLFVDCWGYPVDWRLWFNKAWQNIRILLTVQ